MQRLTHQEAKDYIESFEGYKLLSKGYKRARSKLKIQCPEGHIFWMTYNNFQQGKRCGECYGAKKHTYTQVKDYIESFQGYKLLSKEYESIHTKLEIQCPLGHVFWLSYIGFKRGRGCPGCAGNEKLTIECVKDYVESFQGYKLLSKEYKNNSTKLEMQCPKGHVFWMSYGSFHQGKRCGKCYRDKRQTYTQVKNCIESFEGYKLLSEEYERAHSKLKMQCSKGHIFWASYSKFRDGRRCPKCYKENRFTPNQEFIDKLSFCESIKENGTGQIEVVCAYCGNWHIPERRTLLNRVGYIEGNIKWENRFYCSQQCKNECPIFGQVIYPKENKPATSREAQPELRQMVLTRDEYTCQKCGFHKDELDVGLHCHHIYPLNESPITSADVDTCITYCKDCHKEVHMDTAGCGYSEMKCSA